MEKHTIRKLMSVVFLGILILLPSISITAHDNQKIIADYLTSSEQASIRQEIKENMEVRRFLRKAEETYESDTEKGKAETLYRIYLITDAILHSQRKGEDIAIEEKVGTYSSAHQTNSIYKTFTRCFFSQYHYFQLLYNLHQEQLISEDIVRKGNEIADAGLLLPETCEIGPNNRPAHKALSMVYAMKLYPSSYYYPQWKSYSDAVWNSWYVPGGTYKPGYVAHNLSKFIELGIQTDRTEELKSEKIRKCFYRFRDHISATGLTFSPGDGASQEQYLQGLIEAAEITGDSTLFWAADKVFWAGDYCGSGGTRRDRNDRANQEEYNSRFKNLLEAGLQPVTPKETSQIQGLFPATLNVPDRLILTSSREKPVPYAAFYILDAAETTHHAHEDTRGELYHYEVDGVMYLHRPGWIKWPGHTNTFVVEDEIQEFPFYNTLGLRSDYWYKGSANLRLLKHFNTSETYTSAASFNPVHDSIYIFREGDTPGFFYVNPDAFSGKCSQMRINRINLNFHSAPRNEKPTYSKPLVWYREYREIAPCDSAKIILIDNLSISGPKGRKLIYDFETIPSGTEVNIYPPGSIEDPSLVRNFKGKELEEVLTLVPGKNGQGMALQVLCNMGRTELLFNEIDIPVDLNNEYTRVDLDYCYKSDVSEFLRPPFKIGINNHTPRSMYVDRQQGGILTNAEIFRQGDDQLGFISYDGVYTYDSGWNRKTLLTQEGYLIVVDEYLPGKSADGLTGGPVWQLMNAPESGLHWFDAVAGVEKNKKLLVYFHPDRKNSYGTQFQPKILDTPPFYAAYARTKFTAGSPARFISVMMPHEASETAIEVMGKTLRNGVITGKNNLKTSLDGNGNAEISLYDSKSKNYLHIKIEQNGRWEVKRSLELGEEEVKGIKE